MISASPAPPGVVAPVDPRLRIMLLALRRAFLMAAEAIAVYCENGEKVVR